MNSNGSPMAPSWLLDGSFMAPRWLLHGSSMAPFMAPRWLLHGSFMAPSWLLDGSTMAPLWLHYGSITAPSRIQELSCCWLIEWCFKVVFRGFRVVLGKFLLSKKASRNYWFVSFDFFQFSSVKLQPGSVEITFFQPHTVLSDSVEIFTGFSVQCSSFQ